MASDAFGVNYSIQDLTVDQLRDFERRLKKRRVWLKSSAISKELALHAVRLELEARGI